MRHRNNSNLIFFFIIVIFIFIFFIVWQNYLFNYRQFDESHSQNKAFDTINTKDIEDKMIQDSDKKKLIFEKNGRYSYFKQNSSFFPGHGLTCPPYDPDVENLQIPLEHLPRKKKTNVRQKYDRRAHNCAKNGIWNRLTINDHRLILDNIVRLARINKDEFVLDWGSGCGHSLQFLFSKYNVTGVGLDVSNKTIEYARENTSKSNLHCVADGTKLDWIPDNFFDHAYSFGSIYHVYNKTIFCHVLRQLVRVIRVGGTVYNGWSDNSEFHRNYIDICLNDLGVSFEILEEFVEFKNVPIFPLKAKQLKPNTYSLVITKKRALSSHLYSWESIPIVCSKKKCWPIKKL